MNKIKSEIIMYSKMLNSKKLSALRSGNISIRYKNGFFITPSGKKYTSLKNSDIVFVKLDGTFNKKKGIPSSEWKFNQDIYLSKKQNKVLETILKKELKDGQADWLVDGERDWSVVSAILEKLKGEK